MLDRATGEGWLGRTKNLITSLTSKLFGSSEKDSSLPPLKIDRSVKALKPAVISSSITVPAKAGAAADTTPSATMTSTVPTKAVAAAKTTLSATMTSTEPAKAAAAVDTTPSATMPAKTEQAVVPPRRVAGRAIAPDPCHKPLEVVASSTAPTDVREGGAVSAPPATNWRDALKRRERTSKHASKDSSVAGAISDNSGLHDKGRRSAMQHRTTLVLPSIIS